MSKPSWITISPVSGEDDAAVTITAASHTGRVDRTGTITASTTKGKTVSVNVLQSGAEEMVTATNTILYIPQAGGSVRISGKSNAARLTFAWKAGSFMSDAITSYTANGREATNGKDIPKDPGASAEYMYYTDITAPANTTGVNKNSTLIITTSGGKSVTITMLHRK